MARPDKAAAVAELTEEFRRSSGAVLTEYRGLTVQQLRELRRALGDNATYSVVKNTLTKIAAREAGVDSFDDLLSGPTAIAFIKGDAVETAKALRDFARANTHLVVKGGVLDQRPISVDELTKLADLESREVLLAKLAGALLASLQNAAALFNAPLVQAARLAGALRDKAQDDASVLAGDAGEPAAEAAPAAASEPAAAGAIESIDSTDAADSAESSASTDDGAATAAAGTDES